MKAMLRARTRRPLLIVSVAVVAMTGCGDQTGNRPGMAGPSPSSSDTRSSQKQRRDSRSTCSKQFPFEVTYLPEGFSRDPRSGSAPGAPAAEKGQVVKHYRGNDGRYVEIRRPGTRFSELALGADAPSIKVLRRRTANLGPIEPGGNNLIIQFRFAAGSSPRGCEVYSLDEYGLPMKELMRIARGLRPVDP